MTFAIEVNSRFALIVLDEDAVDTFERALQDVRRGHQVIINNGQGPLTKIRAFKPDEVREQPNEALGNDDAAVERATEALRNSEWAASITPGRTVADDQSEEWARERVRRILHAAGEEPQ